MQQDYLSLIIEWSIKNWLLSKTIDCKAYEREINGAKSITNCTLAILASSKVRFLIKKWLFLNFSKRKSRSLLCWSLSMIKREGKRFNIY